MPLASGMGSPNLNRTRKPPARRTGAPLAHLPQGYPRPSMLNFESKS